MQPRRHQEIARAFRRGCRQDRGLEFGEALLDHPAADGRDHLRAQRDVLVQALAAQVEKAILQPRVLGIIQVAEHRHRQFGRSRLHGRLFDAKLDLAGRHVRIDGVVRARFDLARQRQNPFRACFVDLGEGRRVRFDYTLGDAIMIPQVDEQQTAMVAPPVDPAGQAHAVADVLLAQFATGVGAIGVHCKSFKNGRYVAGSGGLGQGPNRPGDYALPVANRA